MKILKVLWLPLMLLLEFFLVWVWMGIDMNENCGDVGYDEGWTCNYELQDFAAVGLIVVPVVALAGAIYFRLATRSSRQ